MSELIIPKWYLSRSSQIDNGLGSKMKKKPINKSSKKKKVMNVIIPDNLWEFLL